MAGPTLEFSQSLHAEKYRGDGENFREAMNRIAGALTENEEAYHDFREIIGEMRFLPAGRIQTAVGSTKNVTPYNCFVSGTIEDSFVDGHGSIMQRATDAAATMRMGGGIGYDFSTLRPKGALIKKLQSSSSGPMSFMEIFNAVCKCVASSGHRRGAQMGVMRIDHPDIEEFIHAKQNESNLTGFNISIAVTDQFMQCLETGRSFNLRFGNETYKEIDPRALWENIMRSTWDYGEPGVLFIDRINNENNLKYCETIAATNPCGEQPLPPHGACLLGSFNLVKYLNLGVIGGRSFNWNQFRDDIPTIVRAMDRVVDVAIYPMYEQEKEAKSKRRMGLGVTGLANTLEYLGMPYGSPEFLKFEHDILTILAVEAYRASALLSRDKAPFSMYNQDKYLASDYIQRVIPDDVKELIKKYGIRNSHLTSIAPTGTISMSADNVSSGIEPVFSYSADRIYIGQDGPEQMFVKDYGYSILNVKGKQCKDVTVDEHLSVLTVASRLVDSAVSKTLNVPSDTPWADFKGIYTAAWMAGCKGCTTFQTKGKRKPMMQESENNASCSIDSESGLKECE